MHNDVLPACMSEDVRCPGVGATDSSELPCGYWGLNLCLSHIGPNPRGTKKNCEILICL